MLFLLTAALTLSHLDRHILSIVLGQVGLGFSLTDT